MDHGGGRARRAPDVPLHQPRPTPDRTGVTMDGRSLTELAEAQLATAHQAGSGRSAITLHGGREHELRQTLIALVAGHVLGEHESPGEATLQVLSGHVRLTAGEQTWDGTT